jgi:hypothetical protein
MQRTAIFDLTIFENTKGKWILISDQRQMPDVEYSLTQNPMMIWKTITNEKYKRN